MADIGPLVSGAIGILGVAVGLTGDILRRRWQRPRLELLPYDPDSGDAVFFDMWTIQEKAAFLRMRVSNAGRETARAVEVCIEAVRSVDPNPDSIRAETFSKHVGGLVGRRLKWADRDEPFVSIPPASIRRIDIANVSDAEPFYDAGEGVKGVPIRMTLSKRSNMFRDLLPDMCYEIRLSLSGENCEAKQYIILLVFGGRWTGNDVINTSNPDALRIDCVTEA